MDERGDDRQPDDARSEGGFADHCAERLRWAIEDVGWLMRRRIAWPAQSLYDALGTRGMIGVFGGGGIAVAGVVAAILVASPAGGGSNAGTTEAFVAPPPSRTAAVAPAPEPKKKAQEPSGRTLHGVPPSFATAPSKRARIGAGYGKALGDDADAAGSGSSATETSAPAPSEGSGEGPTARGSSAGAGDAPAATAKIGATPEASASATARDGILDRASGSGVPGSLGKAGDDGLITPPAPKAAKQVARHFAEAFVVYETGGIDTHVRQVFGATSTKQLSKSLLKRPPRQPDGVKVPRAKVVNVVAGPSRGKAYSVSVSLLRVGVTSELRLQMEQGVGKKWQVTNVLG